MRTIYQPCGKRGFIVVIKSRRKKRKKKKRKGPTCSSSPSPSLSHRRGAIKRQSSSLIKIFMLRRLFPMTSSDCRRIVRALSPISRAHRCFRWKSSNGGSACARTSRYVAQFFTRLSRDDVSARALENVFLSSLDERGGVVLLHFIRETFAETRKRDFCESVSSVYEEDDRREENASGRRKEGWINYRLYLKTFALSAAEIGPNRANEELCKL